MTILEAIIMIVWKEYFKFLAVNKGLQLVIMVAGSKRQPSILIMKRLKSSYLQFKAFFFSISY